VKDSFFFRYIFSCASPKRSGMADLVFQGEGACKLVCECVSVCVSKCEYCGCAESVRYRRFCTEPASYVSRARKRKTSLWMLSCGASLAPPFFFFFSSTSCSPTESSACRVLHIPFHSHESTCIFAMAPAADGERLIPLLF
jgi:hypothetical protein